MRKEGPAQTVPRSRVALPARSVRVGRGVVAARPHVDAAVFRDVIGHFMSGVTVVTTATDDGTRFGVTASAIASLSLDPPLVLVCLNRRLVTRDAAAQSGVLAVNILDEDQGEIARQFATRHADKFRGVETTAGELGAPILVDALAQLECSVEDAVDAATHTVFICRVHSATARQGSPLAYFRGTFGRFAHDMDRAVLDEIRRRILHREVALEETLTVESLARQLQVSAGPVYNALQQVRAEGLIRPGDEGGYVVTPLTVEVAWQAYDARAAIELGVVDMVCGHVSLEQAEELRAAAAATTPWVRNNLFVDLDRFLATNARFHDILLSLAGNEMLVRVAHGIGMLGVLSRALPLRMATTTSDRAVQDHVDLAEAIAAGDAKEARRLIIAHTLLGKERAALAIRSAGGQF